MSDVFDAYSRYYDLLYRDKDYAAEAEYVASLLRRMRRKHAHPGAGLRHRRPRRAPRAHGLYRARRRPERDHACPAAVRKAALPAEVAARLSFGEGDVRTVRTGEPTTQ